MKYSEWTESYSVSVKTLDDQHKRLFTLINDYYEAISQKKLQDATSSILRGLEDYTQYHFGDEEKLLLQYNYPAYEEHKAQHDHFVSTIQDYRKRIAEGRLLISLEITNFLKDWLVNHIQVKDKQYAPFLSAKGIR